MVRRHKYQTKYDVSSSYKRCEMRRVQPNALRTTVDINRDHITDLIPFIS